MNKINIPIIYRNHFNSRIQKILSSVIKFHNAKIFIKKGSKHRFKQSIFHITLQICNKSPFEEKNSSFQKGPTRLLPKSRKKNVCPCRAKLVYYHTRMHFQVVSALFAFCLPPRKPDRVATKFQLLRKVFNRPKGSAQNMCSLALFCKSGNNPHEMRCYNTESGAREINIGVTCRKVLTVKREAAGK